MSAGLTQLIQSLVLMTLIKNLRRHSRRGCLSASGWACVWQSGRWCWWDGCAAGQTRIKALVGASWLHDRQLVYLHGAGKRSPTHFSGGARAPGSCRVSWPTHQSEVGGSCEAETCRARRGLLVRGGDLSGKISLIGNWSEMLPTGRSRDVLPVWVLIEVLSLPRLESWPSRYW
jgi:hypothetical protein